MSGLHLTCACGDHDRTRALEEGTARPDGIDLTSLRLPGSGDGWAQTAEQGSGAAGPDVRSESGDRTAGGLGTRLGPPDDAGSRQLAGHAVLRARDELLHIIEHLEPHYFASRRPSISIVGYHSPRMTPVWPR